MGVSEHQGAGESDLSTQPTSAKHGLSVLAWHLDQGIWLLREEKGSLLRTP